MTATLLASGLDCTYVRSKLHGIFCYGSETTKKNLASAIIRSDDGRSGDPNNVMEISCRTQTAMLSQYEFLGDHVWYQEWTEKDFSYRVSLSDLIPSSATGGDVYMLEKAKITCGLNCTFFLLPNGVIYKKDLLATARTEEGELPNVPEIFRTPPAQGQPKPVKIVCGHNHVMVLLDDGTVDGWGDNSRNQIPHKNNPIFFNTHNHMKTRIRVTDIACGENHTLVLLETGNVFGFGSPSHGQSQNYIPPSQRVMQIACGGNHSLALLDNGTVIGWGDNSYGQLGDINLTPREHHPFFDVSQCVKQNSPPKGASGSTGGSLLKQKYLKYKQKYLELKNI
jgi:hypothetical protein